MELQEKHLLWDKCLKIQDTGLLKLSCNRILLLSPQILMILQQFKKLHIVMGI